MKFPIRLLPFVLLLLTLPTACAEATPTAKEVKIIPFGRFQSTFNDMNNEHLSAAKEIGISCPKSREDVEHYGRKLRRIKNCDAYEIATLTHSVPYLVPEAKELLEEIGEEFEEIQEDRGVSGYAPIVTSVLRTLDDVKRLTRSNSNASPNSAHCYGTTFDISYTRFARTNNRYEVPEAQIKHLLAEVLRNLQKEKRCYVRYEVRQGCFHITVRN